MLPADLTRSMRRHSLILGLFAAATALLVGLVHEFTRDEIHQQRRAAERRALYEVLPPTEHDNDLLGDAFILSPSGNRFSQPELLGLREPATAYLARLGGTVSGVILPLRVHDGYNGDISLLVGVRRDGTLSGVRVLEHRETPGLGDRIELAVSGWILDFDGKSLQNPPPERWGVKKDGGDFDQFVGATVTPRAVINGVRQALLFFQANRDQLLASVNPGNDDFPPQ